MKLQSNAMTTGMATLLCLTLAAAAFAAEPPATADKTTAPAARPEPKLSASAQPRANTSGTQAPTSSTAQNTTQGTTQSKAQSKAPAARKTNDRIDLGTTVVTGNRELPKVLYIVPWKKADIGNLPAQPFNTLLDEVLTPVDRDVFRREVTYYGAIADGAGAPVSSSPSSEK